MAEALYRLGRFCATRPWRVLGTWLAILVLSGIAYALGSGPLSQAVTIPGIETVRVTQELAERLPAASGGAATVVFDSASGEPLTDEQRDQISATLDEVAQVDGVQAVVDPFETADTVEENASQIASGREQIADAQAQLADGAKQLADAQAQINAGRAFLEASGGATADQLAQLDAAQAEVDANREKLADGRTELAAQSEKLENGATLLELAAPIRTVSQDGTAALATVVFDQSLNVVPQETKEAVTDILDEPIEGVTVAPSGDLTWELPQVIGPGEVLGLLVAGLALQLMLGTFVAAAVPVMSALVGVGVAVLVGLSFSGAVDMLSVTPVLGIMLGLAVGIDYSLFILNRHRHQVREGVELTDSVGLATGTAGNAVVFAGSTVLVALLALNVTGIAFLGMMGTIGALGVAVAVLVAITVTPALLGLLGMRVLPKRLRDEPEPPDLVHTPMSDGTAWLRVLGSAAVLLVIAIPALSMRLGLPDGASQPQGSSAYQAHTLTAEKFGPGANGPVLVVVDVPEPISADELTAEQAHFATLIAQTAGVEGVAPIGLSDDGRLLAFQVQPTEGPNSESTADLVNTLRSRSPMGEGVTVGVAGAASGNIDVSAKLAEALPRYLLLVVGISLIIMLLVFRSILVPLMAAAGFVMSLFAAFGGIVAIFQWGWLSSLFGIHDPGPVLSFLPTFLVGVLFGLAMDYQLFLTSGMREAYVHGVPAQVAVRRGFNAGRVVVTVAAIIMISVFGGFVFSEMIEIRSIGFGLALGVALDAFLVRMGLIPGLMHLIGERAWWLPRWLDRIMPNVDVEGASLERSHPHPTQWAQESGRTAGVGSRDATMGA